MEILHQTEKDRENILKSTTQANQLFHGKEEAKMIDEQKQ